MAKKRYRPEEVVVKLRKADVLIGQGKEVSEVIKVLGVTDDTYYRWRSAEIIRSAIETSQAGPQIPILTDPHGVRLVQLFPSLRERKVFLDNVHRKMKSDGFRIALSAIPKGPNTTIEDIIKTVAAVLPGDPTEEDPD